MNYSAFVVRVNGGINQKSIPENFLQGPNISQKFKPKGIQATDTTNQNKQSNIIREQNIHKNVHLTKNNQKFQENQQKPPTQTNIQFSKLRSNEGQKISKPTPNFSQGIENNQKSTPGFLKNMKKSLFLPSQYSSNSIPSNFYNSKNSATNFGPIMNNNNNRPPRMSEQPGDMKSSSIQMNGNYKIPSFLQKKCPYQTELERPESSKQTKFNAGVTIESLTSSYGSMKRSKADFDSQSKNFQKKDPATQWINQSWNKKREKKISINDFQKISELGCGKYGSVYLARQKKTNFILALKIIEKKLLRQQEITEQFIRQLKIQSFLNHPNIIKMYGFFDDTSNIYILLEVGTGGQLFRQLKKHQSMPQQKVANFIRQVCVALNELHANRIIHRDIKPQNIVLSQGVLKLCDFGWSVHFGSSLRTTFCGTPLYVGPQILKGVQYDQKIDIWSLGVMMYEMLIGENPFQITKEQQLIKIVKDQIKIPEYVSITQEARDFMMSCLQKNPNNRLTIRQLLKHNFLSKYPQKMDKKFLQ